MKRLVFVALVISAQTMHASDCSESKKENISLPLFYSTANLALVEKEDLLEKGLLTRKNNEQIKKNENLNTWGLAALTLEMRAVLSDYFSPYITVKKHD